MKGLSEKIFSVIWKPPYVLLDCLPPVSYIYVKSASGKDLLKFMDELKLRQEDEFIKLGQALKAVNLVSSGVEAKIVIQNGEVLVNGEVDTRRGKKLYNGDTFTYQGKTVKVIR